MKLLPIICSFLVLFLLPDLSHAVVESSPKERTASVSSDEAKKEQKELKKKQRKEKKQLRKKARKRIKQAIKNLRKGAGSEVDRTLLIILAIIIPPLAVGLYDGITNRFWISLLLTLLFWLPGAIYSLIVVLE